VLNEEDLPEWVSYNEKGDIDFVGVLQDVVAGRLDHLSIGYDDISAIESFLLL
jgi:hypothetical protein